MKNKKNYDISMIKDLLDKGFSTYKIAEELGCNQSHVYRIIQKYNKANPNSVVKVKSKSEAQKSYLKEHGHQRVGAQFSEESREKISDALKAHYDSADGDKTRQKITDVRNREWDKKSPVEKSEIMNKLKVAQREALKINEGSKFENFVASELTSRGYAVEQRNTSLADGLYEVDIVLKNEGIAIEIDGPTHFMDTYGADKLLKTQAKDADKNTLLNAKGWDVLRVQDASSSCSRARISRIDEQIKSIVEAKKGNKRYASAVYYLKP